MTPRRNGYARTIAILVAVLVIASVAYHLFSPSSPPQPSSEEPPAKSTAGRKLAETKASLVEKVIDGDTLVLGDGEKVRLIGVDTPETSHPEVPVQRFGKEATAFTRKTAEGLKVRLEFDGPRKDAYGRTLAYVFVGDTLLNKEIIRRGYGYAMTRFPHSRMDDFLAAEREARAKQYGLWNYSLTDGRLANLADRYESLSPEGKKKLDEFWDELLKEYPASDKEENEDERR